MSISISSTTIPTTDSYNLTAVHAFLKADSSKHPAMFEHDTEFHHFNACGHLTASFEENAGMTHWGDLVCLEAYSRWLGYESLSHLTDALPTEE